MKKYANAISGIPIPDRIKALPVSPKGFPVPWFVAWANGVPDFRVIDTPKIAKAVKQRLCFTCGQPLGVNLAVTIGPMCAINRTISEPPSHRDCAVFSATACPFLSNPKTKRNTRDLPDDIQDAAGFGIKRNPGAIAVWITRDVRLFKVDNGVLFRFGDPSEVLWFAEGRKATRAEVQASIDSGLPILRELAEKQGDEAIAALALQTERARQFLPAAP
jgi:hypothetical protein